MRNEISRSGVFAPAEASTHSCRLGYTHSPEFHRFSRFAVCAVSAIYNERARRRLQNENVENAQAG
jgi:hypothetical protein